MARKKDQKYYAVARGACEGIYSTWAKACALTTSYPGNLHKSFQDYNDAVAYMNAHGKFDFFIDAELAPVRSLSGKKRYAVANGRTRGVFEAYERAQSQVHEYSNACHQSFDTEKDAAKHIQTFDAMWIIRADIEGMMNISI